MYLKYKYMNGKLLNVAEMEPSLCIRNCLKPNKENKNHKSNLHPQPPKGKHLKFFQLKKRKKERTENSSHRKREINHRCWENSERRCPQCTSQKIQWRALSNRRIKTKQRGKHRTVHKANPEVFLLPGTSDSCKSYYVNMKNTSSGA